MPKIKNVATGNITEVSQTPVFVGGIWECGSQRFTDATGTEYEVVEGLVEYPQLSPVQFKMCFTPQERIAIKALRATNQIIDDAYEILDDPRLTTVDMALASNQQMIDYLVSLAALTPERAAQIKAGIML